MGRPSARSRQPLTRDALLDEALRLTKAQGLSRLTMKRLGEAFGVSEPAVYYYFEDRDDLCAAVIDKIAFEFVRRLADVTGSWQEQVWQLAEIGARLLLEYPNTADYFGERDPWTPGGALVISRLTTILMQSGASENDSALYAWHVFQYIHGYARWYEIVTRGEQARRARREVDSGTSSPAEHAEHAFRKALRRSPPRERFFGGLSILLQGLEAEIAATTGKRIARQARTLARGSGGGRRRSGLPSDTESPDTAR